MDPVQLAGTTVKRASLHNADEIKRLNERTEKLSDRTLDIDKRLVRLETMVEISQRRLPPH